MNLCLIILCVRMCCHLCCRWQHGHNHRHVPSCQRIRVRGCIWHHVRYAPHHKRLFLPCIAPSLLPVAHACTQQLFIHSPRRVDFACMQTAQPYHQMAHHRAPVLWKWTPAVAVCAAMHVHYLRVCCHAYPLLTHLLPCISATRAFAFFVCAVWKPLTAVWFSMTRCTLTFFCGF